MRSGFKSRDPRLPFHLLREHLTQNPRHLRPFLFRLPTRCCHLQVPANPPAPTASSSLIVAAGRIPLTAFSLTLSRAPVPSSLRRPVTATISGELLLSPPPTIDCCFLSSSPSVARYQETPTTATIAAATSSAGKREPTTTIVLLLAGPRSCMITLRFETELAEERTEDVTTFTSQLRRSERGSPHTVCIRCTECECGCLWHGLSLAYDAGLRDLSGQS
ncbi:hypothetical protein LXL04_002534 [Taraxacum kok-saghyz]